MPERRSNQISDLYLRALGHAPAERERFLREACGEDEALRQELEALLEFDPVSNRFLEPPAVRIVAPGASVADSAIGMIDRALGPYTLTSRLGAGGMGEVYRARDSRLGREVAIKILPPHFTGDPERRARFAREARVLATLNHPHIGAIYGLEESDGVTGLVLELVEGQTLAERLERRRLSITDALVIARQIAEALSAAHEKGIVHRDLKPANIVLQTGSITSSAPQAKVLDFGLAKPMRSDSDVALTQLPAGSLEKSVEGRILGTPAYMSPEQARGLAVDRRSDIWAFGCVLFEMLSGTRAFEGKTISDTIARLLEREPDWNALPPDTPAACRRLLERCLRKDPARRLHDIADARLEIDDAIRSGESEAAQTAAIRHAAALRTRLVWMACAMAVVALAALGTALVWRPAGAPVDRATESLQFRIPLPPDTRLEGPRLSMALSPDGTHLAMALQSVHKPTRLWLAALRSDEARELPGTDDAMLPFWSPDSRRIGFFSDGRLKTVTVDGSGLMEICAVRPGIAVGGESMTGGSWSHQGLILFWSETGPLMKVSATGGVPVPATELADGELVHGWPAFLPDGEHFLYLAYGPEGRGVGQLRVGSARSPQSTPLGPVPSAAVYASGHILFVDGGLMAQRFDVDSLRRIGEPQMVVPRVRVSNGRGMFSVSDIGLLAHEEWVRVDTPLTWFDRQGNRLGMLGEPGLLFNLGLSPDDRRLAISRAVPEAGVDIHVIELTRAADTRRLTTDPAAEYDPAWSPDGTQIVFTSNRGGRFRLFRRPADGSGTTDDLFAEVPAPAVAPAWSPDGRFVIFAAGGGLWIQPVEPGAVPVRFGRTGEGEAQPSFSPDGRWVVYQSTRTGRSEIYVRPFPSGDRDYKVSIDGGAEPRWRAQQEIFFLSPDGRMMSARVTSEKTFESAIPQQLFATGQPWLLFNGRPYDVTRDGQRFIFAVGGPRSSTSSSTSIPVLTNWTARLSK